MDEALKEQPLVHKTPPKGSPGSLPTCGPSPEKVAGDYQASMSQSYDIRCRDWVPLELRRWHTGACTRVMADSMLRGRSHESSAAYTSLFPATEHVAGTPGSRQETRVIPE